MASDDAVKKLLAKFVVTTDDFDESVKKMRATLRSLEEEETSRVSKAKKDTTEAIDAQKEQIKNLKVMQETARAASEAEKAKTSTIRKQQEEIKKNTLLQKQGQDAVAASDRARTETIKQQTMQQRAAIQQQIADARRASAEQVAAARKAAIEQLAEMRKQASEEAALHKKKLEHIREEAAEERKKRAEEREGLSGKGIAKALGTGVFGGGLTSKIAGGVLLGNLEFEALYEGIEKLTDKVKEFVEDSGGLQKVLETFQKLSRGFGEEPQKFMEKLFEATQHLVPQIDLLRTANTFMQSGLKISAEDMLRLTEATVGLARAQGRDANEAVQALNRSFLTGRSQMLAYVTGIQRTNLQMEQMGSMMSTQQKNQLQFEQTMKVITQRFQEMGAPALTFTDRLRQMKVMSDEVFENMAQGVVKSGGFSVVLGGMADVVSEFGDAESAGNNFGNALGNTIGGLVIAFKPLVELIGDILNLFVQIQVNNPFNNSIKTGIGQAKDSLSGFQTFMLGLADTVRFVADLFRRMANTGVFLGKTTEAMALNITHPGNAFSAISAAKAELDAKENAINQKEAEESNKNYTRMIMPLKVSALQEELEKNKAARSILETASKKYRNRIPDAVRMQMMQQLTDIARDKKVSTANGQTTTSYRTDFTEEMAKQAAASYLSTAGTTVGNAPDANLAYRTKEQVDKANIEKQKKLADEAFEDAKARIQEEADANEKMYKAGEEDAKAYYAAKKKQADETYEATIAHINSEIDAQKKSIENQVKENNLSRQAANIQIEALNHEKNKQIQSAKSTRDKAYSGADIGELQEEQKSRIALADLQLQNTKSVVAQEKEAVQNAFKEQLISAQTYTTQRIALMDEEVRAEKERRDVALANQSGDVAQRLDTLKQYQTAMQEQMKELQSMQQQLPDTLLQDMQTRYQARLQALQGRLSIANTGASGMALVGASPDVLQEQMKHAMESQITELVQLMNHLTPYSETWNKVYSDILRSTEQLMSFNQQLENSRSIQPYIGSIFSTLGEQLSPLFGSYFARGVESALSGVGRQLQNAPNLVQTLKGGKAQLDPKIQQEIQPILDASGEVGRSFKQTGDVFVEADQQIRSAISNLVSQLNFLASKIAGITGGGTTSNSIPNIGNMEVQSAVVEGGLLSPQKLQTMGNLPTTSVGEGGVGGLWSDIKNIFKGGAGQQGISGAFKDLTTKSVALTQAFGSFIGTIESSGSATAGAFSGAAGGASLGSSIGSSAGLKGGAADALTGGLAAAGLIFGIIAGQKQEAVQDDINKLNYAYKGLMNAFSSNNASLQATVQGLQNLIAQAQADEASTKKGSGQFKNLILQYQEQIDQLQNQAKQTMVQLKEQLAVLSSPVPYQQMVGNIEQVIQQYSQFVGAAQNANDLANANKFLSESLQQMAQGYSEQLLQDEETAVQNALNLNNLLSQRNQLQYQYLQQTESIMGQGTITRSQTLAQSKFSQMYQASVSYSNQLMDINQQIAIAQAQVSAAQTVFHLATTRQGLESQMVQLQTQSIALDMARIAAMKNLVDTLAATGYTIPGLSGMNTKDPNMLILQVLGALLGGMGIDISGLLSQTSGGTTKFGGPPSQPGPISGGGRGRPRGGSLDGLSADAYAQLAQMGLGGFHGLNL